MVVVIDANYRTHLALEYQFFVGHEIAQLGQEPVGRVACVDERGAWLEEGGRIEMESLERYRAVFLNGNSFLESGWKKRRA